MNRKLTLTFLFSLYFSYSFGEKPSQEWARIYSEQLFHVTEVMVTDVASPPVAARIYAYTNLAAFMAVRDLETDTFLPDFLSVSTLESQSVPKISDGLSREFIGIYSMLLVGEKIMPSGYLLQEKQKNWINWARKQNLVTRKNLNQHILIAQEIQNLILNLAKSDGYIQLTALPRYSPKDEAGSWFPTPPAYIEAIEPEWRTMRTFFIQNLDEFTPKPMAEFSLEEGSAFRKQLDEIIQVTGNLTEEQKLIANFWDCNPFAVEFTGHMAIGIKKISPGGHWMGITGIAAQMESMDFLSTSYIHALIGMTLHDSFVSCWKAKYETHRIRPETVINQHLNPSWKPLLQTPPFPEYTSGHSVISTAAARVLTEFFGENFSFIDSSEVYFGLPERAFSSFNQAASEAAISRLYGGIHFRDAIENGVNQGEKIADHILNRLQVKQNQ